MGSQIPSPDAFYSLSDRFIGCLSNELHVAHPTTQRASLLLSILARINVCSFNGRKNDIDSLVEKLGDYLKSLTYDDFCEETDSFTKVEEYFESILSTLASRPNGLGDLEDRICELQCKFERLRRLPQVFVLETVYQEDLDGFAVETPPKKELVERRSQLKSIENDTLLVLYRKVAGGQSENISKNETVMHALAVFVKICSHLDRYGDVFEALFSHENLAVHHLCPRTWNLMTSLLLLSACRIFKSTADREMVKTFQKRIIICIISQIRKLLETVCTLERPDHSAEMKCLDKSMLIYVELTEAFCMFRCIMDFLLFTCKLNDGKKNCMHGSRYLENAGLVPVIRDAMNVAERLVPWQLELSHSLDAFLVSFKQMLVFLCNCEKLCHSVKEFCPSKFFHCILVVLLKCCPERAFSTKILKISMVACDGFCRCVGYAAIIDTFLTKKLLDHHIPAVTEALVYHLWRPKIHLPVRRISTLDVLIQKIRSSEGCQLMDLMKVTSAVSPRMNAKDLEILSVIVVKRLIELYPCFTTELELQCDAVSSSLVDYLSSNLVGEEAISCVIREMLLPVIGCPLSSVSNFDVIFALTRRCFSHMNTSSSSIAKESLLMALSHRFLQGLRSAEADIWILVNANSFFEPLIYVAELLYSIILNNSCENLPVVFIDELKTSTNGLLNVLIEWMQTPSRNFLKTCRVGELCAICLRIAGHLGCIEDKTKIGLSSVLSRNAHATSRLRLLLFIVRKILADEDYNLKMSGLTPSLIATEQEPEACTYTVSLLEFFLKGNRELRSGDLYYIKQVCKALQVRIGDSHAYLTTSSADDLLGAVMRLAEMSLSTSVTTFPHILLVLTQLISSKPSILLIKFLIKSLQKKQVYQVALSALLTCMEKERIEPRETLLFPKKMLEGLENDSSPEQEHKIGVTIPKDQQKVIRSTLIAYISQTSRSLLDSPKRLLSKHFGSAPEISELGLRNVMNEHENLQVRKYRKKMRYAAKFRLESVRMLAFSNSLSLSFWFRLKQPATDKVLPASISLHVCSLYSDALSCTLSLSPNKRALYLSYTCGSEKARLRVKSKATVDLWNHVSLSLNVTRAECTVNVNLNSVRTHSVFQYNDRRPFDASRLTFAFGAIQVEEDVVKNTYSISSIFAFIGTLSFEQVLLLRALGSDSDSLHVCNESGLQHRLISLLDARIGTLFFDEVIGLLSSVDQVYATLLKNHCFTLSCRTANIVHCNVVCKPERKISWKMSDKPPFNIPVYWRCRCEVEESKPSVYDSLITFGAQRLFFFIFAQTVDRRADSSAQVSALQMLIQFLRRLNPYLNGMSISSTYDIVTRCLTSPHAAVNPKLIEEVCHDAFLITSSNHPLEDEEIVDPLIIDPELLKSVACTAAIWRGTDRMHCWLQLLKAIAHCLSEKVCNHDFCRKQLSRVSFLPALLQTCLEMLHDSNNHAVKKDSVPLLVDAQHAIISALLGIPESADGLARLWRFVFLSHPAACTYLACGHNEYADWIPASHFEDEFSYSSGTSNLRECLNDYIQVLGTEKIAEIWAKERSVLAIKKLYKDMKVRNEDTSAEHSSQLDIETMQQLPDLVSNVAAAEGYTSDANTQKKISVESLKSETSDWFNTLRLEALRLLADALQNSPDDIVSSLLGGAITWQSAVVLLTNQSDNQFRDAVFILLRNFLLRANIALRVHFVKHFGFELLSNQLRGYPASEVAANCLFSLLLGEAVRLDNNINPYVISLLKVDHFKCALFTAFFVLWEESVSHATLPVFWNIASTLLKVFEVNSILMQAMMDAGLCHTLINVLKRITRLPQMISDVANEKSFAPFIQCWQAFASGVIDAFVPYRGLRFYKMCKEFLWLLFLALMQLTSCAESEKLLRGALSQILYKWLNNLEICYSFGDPLDCFSDSEADQETSFNIHPRSSGNDSDKFVCDYAGDSIKGVLDRISANTESWTAPDEHHAELPSWNERSRRMLHCLTAASHFFTILHPSEDGVVTDSEEKLLYKYLSLLTAHWKRENQEGVTGLQSARKKLLAACCENSKKFIGQMIAYVLYPAHEHMSAKKTKAIHYKEWSLKRRSMIVSEICNSSVNMLRSVLEINLDYQYCLSLGLHELALLSDIKDENVQKNVERLIRFLRTMQIESPLATLTPDRLNVLSTDEGLALQSYTEQRKAFLGELYFQGSNFVVKVKNRIGFFSEKAMQITCGVVEDQNALRKQFIRGCRDAELKGIAAEKLLNDLVTDLCHPEGVCHDVNCWPTSAALDPTEGPYRERRRLMPAYITFDLRFLRPGFAEKAKNRERNPPLANLLNDLRADMKGWSLMDILAPGERIILSLNAKVVRSTIESTGELLAGDKKFYFYSDCTRSTQKGLSRKNWLFISWSYEQVIELYKRLYLLQDVAVELFFSDGQTYLIVFDEHAKRDHFIKQLLTSELCRLNSISDTSVISVTQRWREGKMTNFEYLMQLNKLAGRSYNDLMQYPVFPFILSNYVSNILDLSDPKSYRDLSKPMAIQDKKMEQHYLRNYVYLEGEAKRAVPGSASPFIFGPYHYGSHYSNSGIVAHYLVRLPPFTDIALEYQDNNFDIADRLFNSVQTTWRLASAESTTDFKELIPEFFFLHEFLSNSEGLSLGIRQSGDVVDDVQLPKWCSNSPRLFLLIHRQALESSFVSSNLNQWIDLIFGYKQIGKAAIDAINVFHPATYRENTKMSYFEEHDEVSLSALRTMVKTYGQMPLQLFQSPHLPPLIDSHRSARGGTPNPVETVCGIRWGEFVGSPESEWGNLTVSLNELPLRNAGHAYHVTAMPDGICYAVPYQSCFVCKFKEDVCPHEIISYGLLSWRLDDGVLRLRLHQPYFWQTLAYYHNCSITAVVYCERSHVLLVALSSGSIYFYRMLLVAEDLNEFILEKVLYCHDMAVHALAICCEFAIAASGCDGGKVCMWDTNRKAYVRTIVLANDKAVRHLLTSRTNGNVVVVSQSGYGSHVASYTINGLEIGHFETEIAVTALAITSLPEGTAVNCLFLGMQNGVIRIFDMWTMNPVRDIVDYHFLEPIVSMCFANRCTRLYLCHASGRVLCWQGEKLPIKRSPVLKVVTDS